MQDDLISQMLALALQQQATTNIFGSFWFWGIVLPVLGSMFPYFIALAALRGVRTGAQSYQNPLGWLGPLLGIPVVAPKTQEEIAADRQHAYRRWGTIASVALMGGGFLLTILGYGANHPAGSDSVLELNGMMKATNVAPGVVFLAIGFLVWRQTHK